MGKLAKPSEPAGPKDTPPPYSPHPDPPQNAYTSPGPQFPPPQPPPLYGNVGPNGSAPMPQPPPPMQGPIRRYFPTALNVYRGGWGSKMTLGEHQSQPLYAISTHKGFSGKPSVELHVRSDHKAPVLASVDLHSFSSRLSVVVPGPHGGNTAIDVPSQMGWPNRTYTFAIEVGPSGELGVEQFEWRHSRGDAIAALDGTWSGWKLIRLSTGAPGGGGGGGGGVQFTPGGFTTTDGKEVVAAWSNSQMSVTKMAKFQFFGTGANGVLGERWAVMAVITALGLFIKEWNAKSAAGSAA